MILCDVAREDASVIVADLRELDIDVEGSISIEEIDSQISAARERRRARGAPTSQRPGGLGGGDRAHLRERRADHTFVIFMVLAMLIAAVGIFFDQPILIVGAMVVGPEFGPIAGALRRDRQPPRRAGRPLGQGARRRLPDRHPADVPATLLLEAIGEIPDSIDFNAHTFTRFIAEPDFFCVYVAVLAGVVGMLSLTSAKSSALVGVLISVATIPAAANMGVAAAYGDWSIVRGATGQLADQPGLDLRRRPRHALHPAPLLHPPAPSPPRRQGTRPRPGCRSARAGARSRTRTPSPSLLVPVRRLYLLRHAKSSWEEPGLADLERPLAKRGRKACKLIAGHLAEREIAPAVAIVSPARRAQQTFDRVRPGAPRGSRRLDRAPRLRGRRRTAARAAARAAGRLQIGAARRPQPRHAVAGRDAGRRRRAARPPAPQVPDRGPGHAQLRRSLARPSPAASPNSRTSSAPRTSTSNGPRPA